MMVMVRGIRQLSVDDDGDGSWHQATVCGRGVPQPPTVSAMRAGEHSSGELSTLMYWCRCQQCPSSICGGGGMTNRKRKAEQAGQSGIRVGEGGEGCSAHGQNAYHEARRHAYHTWWLGVCWVHRYTPLVRHDDMIDCIYDICITHLAHVVHSELVGRVQVEVGVLAEQRLALTLEARQNLCVTRHRQAAERP